MARSMGYFKFDDEPVITCQHCAWEGAVRALGSGEISFSGGFSEYLCPSCDEIAFLTQHPTTEDVEYAAARGNAKAIRMPARDRR